MTIYLFDVNSSILILIGVFVVVTIAIMVIIRLILKKKLEKLYKKLESFVPFHVSQTNIPEWEITRKEGNSIDISADLKLSFSGQYITYRDIERFTIYYLGLYNDVSRMSRILKTFYVRQPEMMKKIVLDYEGIQSDVNRHNESIVENELNVNKQFFDHCLKYPLDSQQRRSIVSCEDNCLVISSAGSGKTSSIVGKVKYLIEKKHVNPQRILLISFTNKAAAELTERMGIKGLRGYTFHKLAIDIIGQAQGQKPMICSNTDALFIKIYQDLLTNDRFKKSIVEYMLEYHEFETENERRINEHRQLLADQKNTRIKAQFPDMDGKIVYVRSEQERKICNALTSLNVKFRYEEPYEHPLADEMHSQYKPDFSIYYNIDGETKRLYLEHFGVDEHGLVPLWFANDRGMSFEEANSQYNDGITWKKAAHEKFGTKLITTTSADFQYYDVREKLKSLLENVGVPVKEKTDEELYNVFLPSNSKQEKLFIRLIITFVALLKSSCKSISEVIEQTRLNGDERSEFIVDNIFRPVYERYIYELQKINQIDFTDVILDATEICRSSNIVDYDYIIVDEFQDISLDRYNFLKSLREGHNPAKLFCVGDDWQSIYRFSGSDMSLFNQFQDYFGKADIHKIETTYRFGEPLVGLSSQFIQRNNAQIKKSIRSFDKELETKLEFFEYEKNNYCSIVERVVASVPAEKSIFLIGRYSFDDYYLSFNYKGVKEGNSYYYYIANRKIEFLTVHKSKGLEADYVIILQCNKDTYGFPSLVNDSPVLNYVLTKSDQYPYGEERRLFYVAITRAKEKTIVLYDKNSPSVFVEELLHPERITDESYVKHPNANKKWTRKADQLLLRMYNEGKSVKYLANYFGRSQTSIVMRLNKLIQS